MESLRLADTISCPECCFPVKPFVVGTQLVQEIIPAEPYGFSPGKMRKMVHVQCPRKECTNNWYVEGSDEEAAVA